MDPDRLRTLWEPFVDGSQPPPPTATVRTEFALGERSAALTLPVLGPAPPAPRPLVAPESRNAVTLQPGEQRPAAPPSSPLASAEAARFQLVREIGRGSMGAVFRGQQGSLAREVAIKKSLRLKDPKAHDRFVAEARVTAFLEHPNIVPVHELGQEPDGALLLVMKLVGGQSWDDILHPDGGPAPDLEGSLDVLIRVCDAVSYAHSRGIVHCDLKPENIMVGEFGEVLVMDWGIAMDVRPVSPQEARGFHPSEITGPAGTPAYMAPEQARGQGTRIGPWTDAYVLGSILYEILVGRPPHSQGNLWATVMRAASGEPPEWSGSSVPKPLRAICERAMARDPKDRYANARELQEALRGYLQSREIGRFLLWCTGFVSLLVVLGVLVGLLLANQVALESSQEIRYQSFATAMDLQKSSDDLTSMARTYVMTGDPEYEQRYRQILDVRNGVAARPDGTTESIQDRMRRLGFSEREFALLRTSEDNSNALVTTEEIAMNAVKGRFRDADGKFTRTGEPDLELARNSMFDSAYRDAKRAIMAPIDEFVVVLDERTARTVNSHVRLGYIYLVTIVIILLLLICAAITVTVRVFRRVRVWRQ